MSGVVFLTFGDSINYNCGACQGLFTTIVIYDGQGKSYAAGNKKPAGAGLNRCSMEGEGNYNQ